MGERAGAKRRRPNVISDSESDSSDSSSSSSSSDSDSDNGEVAAESTKGRKVGGEGYKIPKKTGKPVWSAEQIKNLKNNFRGLANLDDSILAHLTFKEMAALGNKKDKAGRVLSEKLAENYETVKRFPVRVESGSDHCTGQAHAARFLRGYVGNSQELWLQARKVWGMAGVDPIANYETVSLSLNGFVSQKVWHEVHSPSSKLLSIRLLTNAARKSTWHASDWPSETVEFESAHELKMAVVALDACIRKVMPWNSSFAAVAIFMHSVDFGENDLSGKADKLAFLADFIDEVIQFNAQAWDEERYFMSAQEISSKWSAAFLRKYSAVQKNSGAGSSGKRLDRKKDDKKRQGPEDRVPPGVCKLFQTKACTHPGDKHAAPWDSEYVLRHICAKYLTDKRRYCLGGHARVDHK